MEIRNWDIINNLYKMKSYNNEISRVDKRGHSILVTYGEW